MSSIASQTKSFLKTVSIALLIAMSFRSLLFDPFNIPSGSMKPNLQIGDYVFVNKASYGYSRYSFPFGLMPFEGRIFATAPKRGDIVVFRVPQSPQIFFIKRLIGLPGDEIQFKHGSLFLNGKKVKRELKGTYVDPDSGQVMTKYLETININKNSKKTKSYEILDDIPFHELDNTEKLVIPKNHYFFAGDNRDHSGDSRISQKIGGIGFVHEKFIMGKASMILFSTKAKLWEVWAWISKMDFSRFLIFT